MFEIKYELYSFSPEQLAWEKMLERSLGEFYYYRLVKTKIELVEAVWGYFRMYSVYLGNCTLAI